MTLSRASSGSDIFTSFGDLSDSVSSVFVVQYTRCHSAIIRFMPMPSQTEKSPILEIPAS